jgi:hypothetical protein
MPGPAIRAWHLAQELAGRHQIVLAGTAGATRQHPRFEVRSVTDADLADLLGWCDAVFAPTSVVARHPRVVDSGKPLAIDMYIPTHLENLEPLGASGADHWAAVDHQVSVLNRDLAEGDFFLCASDRQRDFWLGALGSLGRINPDTYAADPSLRTLVDVVPFGLDPNPPPAPSGVLRAAHPAIGPDDPVVIWGGGVYNWFDPISLVRAVADLSGRRPDLRLVFLGMRHPNPGIPEMRMATSLRELAAGLDLTGRHVFFNEGWVPYDQRGAYLAEADLAVSTHLAHVETRFSFRTRVLDYIWAGLPMVLTEGDTLSEEVAAAGLGRTVPPGDPAAIARAIDELLADPPERAAVQRFGAGYRWPAVAGPLLRWAGNPVPAADRPHRPAPPATGAPGDRSPRREAVPPAAAAPAPSAPPSGPPALPIGADLRRVAGRIGRGVVRRVGRQAGRPGAGRPRAGGG